MTRDDKDPIVRDRIEIQRRAGNRVLFRIGVGLMVVSAPAIFVFSYYSPPWGTAATIILIVVVIGCFLSGGELMDRHRPPKRD